MTLPGGRKPACLCFMCCFDLVQFGSTQLALDALQRVHAEKAL